MVYGGELQLRYDNVRTTTTNYFVYALSKIG